MISLSVSRATPLFIASLVVIGLLSLFVVNEIYVAAKRDTHITTAIAAAAAGARVTATEPRL